MPKIPKLFELFRIFATDSITRIGLGSNPFSYIIKIKTSHNKRKTQNDTINFIKVLLIIVEKGV